MGFLLFYPDEAFCGGLPAEWGAAAAGGSRISLTLEEDAAPIPIEILDSDGMADEVDASQCLASDVEIGGTCYGAGTPVLTAYDLIASGSGLKLTSLHFGGTGFQQGPVNGVIATQKLEPGECYRFDVNRTSYLKNNAYDEYVACFTHGTRLLTPDGPREIERLRVGDLVETKDAGARPIDWIGGRMVLGQGACAPIRFARGVLGNDRALRVSPLHRMLIAGPEVALLFGQDEVLVMAKHLVNGDTVRAAPCGLVRYWHVLLAGHQVVQAEGAEAESLRAGPDMVARFGPQIAAELAAGFPARFGAEAGYEPAARLCLKRHEAALLSPLIRGRRARMQHWRAAA